MATHSSILAWRIPWTEEPSGLQSMGIKSQARLSDSVLLLLSLGSLLADGRDAILRGLTGGAQEPSWRRGQSVKDVKCALLFSKLKHILLFV